MMSNLLMIMGLMNRALNFMGEKEILLEFAKSLPERYKQELKLFGESMSILYKIKTLEDEND